MPDGKILYLMRHAEAVWMHSGQRDFDRPLAPKGELDAKEMGQRLKARGDLPDIMLSSPARRATQTTEIIATELDHPFDAMIFRETIYEAGVSDLLDIIQSLNNDYGSAMLIGHNPSISWLINQLTGEHIANAPTGSIATLRTFSPRWEDSNSGTADLLDFDAPSK